MVSPTATIRVGSRAAPFGGRQVGRLAPGRRALARSVGASLVRSGSPSIDAATRDRGASCGAQASLTGHSQLRSLDDLTKLRACRYG